jgi:hypothetical protein
VSRILVPLLLALTMLVATASADAAIVPGKSIAGVKLSMTQQQVKDLLGEPNDTITGSNEFGQFTVFKYRRLRVTFQGNASVTAVKTIRRSERTSKGIGVGSTRAQVKRRVTGVVCEKRLCTKGRLEAGQRVTVFRLFHRRVTSVLVGFVID